MLVKWCGDANRSFADVLIAEPFFVLRRTTTIRKGPRDQLHSPPNSLQILLIKQIHPHVM